MIFLQRQMIGPDGNELIEIAAVELEQNAARYEARGFVRCSFEAFREAWRARDLRALKCLRPSERAPAPRKAA